MTSSACFLRSASRASSSFFCCSILLAILPDLLACASFSRLSSSRSFWACFRFLASSCFSNNGRTSSMRRLRNTFSLGSRLFSIEPMKSLNCSRVTARHSQVMPPNPSSPVSNVACSSIAGSSVGSASLSTGSETFLRLLARNAAFAFLEFFFALGAGGGGGGGSVLRYRRLSSRTM